MYVIKCEGDFQDCERGSVRRAWPMTDDDGCTLQFPSRKEAQAHLDAVNSYPPQYDGIADHNVLSHGQTAGYAPRVARIAHRADRNGFQQFPSWAGKLRSLCTSCNEDGSNA